MGPTKIFCTAKETISKTKNNPEIVIKYLQMMWQEISLQNLQTAQDA